MEIILFFGMPMLVTLPVAILICRTRIARKKPISYGTLFTAAVCIPLLLALVGTIIQPDIWWTHENKNDPSAWPVMLFFMAAMDVLPALGVVVYCQKRQKAI